MNKIYSILLLIFVNISYSQDTRLFDNFWYLREVIDGGQSYVPPVDYMGIDFRPQQSPTKTVQGCLSMQANVTFSSNPTDFSMTNYALCLCGPCSNPAAGNYEFAIYFKFYWNAINSTNANEVNNFTYEITQVGSEKRLIVTSAYNKQAIYSDIRLANTNFEKLDFSFSPNPSKDILEIALKNELIDNVSVEFYNEIGQLCKKVDLQSQKSIVDVKDLPTGAYIVKIKAENEIATKKFIKI